MVMRR